jgi:hypothetical protein
VNADMRSISVEEKERKSIFIILVSCLMPSTGAYFLSTSLHILDPRELVLRSRDPQSLQELDHY